MLLRNRTGFDVPRHQHGAVLYIALIMLVVLALLGVVGMQVSGLQERMASNYRTLNLAFQNAEDGAREAECFLKASVDRTATTCAVVPVDPVCDNGFDASSWAQTQAAAEPSTPRVNVRAIGSCITGDGDGSGGFEGPINENPNPVFQITVFAGGGENAGAGAAIDTIYRP